MPRPEREEFVNVGVVLYCQAADFLDVAWQCDRERLGALDPRLDVDAVCAALAFVEGVCRGDARGGAAAQQSLGQRFGFLKAPKSTVLQPGPVHGGMTDRPRPPARAPAGAAGRMSAFIAAVRADWPTAGDPDRAVHSRPT